MTLLYGNDYNVVKNDNNVSTKRHFNIFINQFASYMRRYKIPLSSNTDILTFVNLMCTVHIVTMLTILNAR